MNVGDHFHHWGLLLDDFNDPLGGDNFLQIKGDLGQQYYNPEKIDYDGLGLFDLKDEVYMCEVSVNHLRLVRRAAEKSPIHHDTPNWNSQDHVIHVLDTLEEMGVLDTDDSYYRRQKRVLMRKKEEIDWRAW
ncbi:hypothetical protein P170DRAFT_473590 [Aspergillus steynii IBT 23096]|uniref:Uncharacterized protein n=1 Tax=Aspergillus steynii IBT 23096 TaxID=1392250 RepID=A0A2I2GAX0_9EURO|nr:uncharacterized protein P170DRAFT_473590 [Aspergillus steynii IBT 23096]PLB50016.1 hypothetical protein P170DRAFT_473590 [Aspergillus steynii IBT 23096]